jgi:hypothetical protein
MGLSFKYGEFVKSKVITNDMEFYSCVNRGLIVGYREPAPLLLRDVSVVEYKVLFTKCIGKDVKEYFTAKQLEKVK